MNLTKLFEAQKVLDDRIVAEKGLQDVDLLDKKILALLTELGELANEYRGFKFWSEDQKSNTISYKCSECGFVSKENIDCPLFEEHIEFHMIKINPLLEEYVDCLHFILSIGNDLGADKWWSKYFVFENANKTYSTERYFLEAYHKALQTLGEIIIQEMEPGEIRTLYSNAFGRFLQLGEMLGFTTDQIEQAYFDKNKINHARQESGY